VVVPCGSGGSGVGGGVGDRRGLRGVAVVVIKLVIK
jgi:hypothetical protein